MSELGQKLLKAAPLEVVSFGRQKRTSRVR